MGGPESVELVEVDEPSADGGVVVDVHAAGVAFPDALLTRGLYQYRPELPFILGAELAGVVRSAPRGSRRPGDRVAGLTMLGGAMAETAVLAAEQVFPLPDNVSFEAGAGLLFNDLTVYFALTTRGASRRGNGAGARCRRWHRHLDPAAGPALGASRVIAVVSTEDKAEVARAAGATDVVLADGFKDAVAELTGGRGVDIVMDPVGGDRFTDSLRSLAPAGRLLVVGFTGGEIPTVKVNRLLLNNIDVVGVGWGAWTLTHPGALAEQWQGLAALLSRGRLAPRSRRSTRCRRRPRRWPRWRTAARGARWCCGSATDRTPRPSGIGSSGSHAAGLDPAGAG